jgi:SAM-dependent methyltransferase
MPARIPGGDDPIARILACPACGADLFPVDAAAPIVCGCGATYPKEGGAWNFLPAVPDRSFPMWECWNRVQENGLASYVSDPENNLSVSRNRYSDAFSKFCGFHGLVLDVGCGPQPLPSYFDLSREAVYVGIDPLPGNEAPLFHKLRGLAERLPFRSGVFDQVIFATTLDHLMDPRKGLADAARVLDREGEIDVWLGEKHPDARGPVVSPEWYLRLTKPDLAEDLFHIRRIGDAGFRAMALDAGLDVVRTEVHAVDRWRTNFFYCLKIAAGR